MRSLLAALLALVAIVIARPAWAQVDLRARADAEVIGLGDVVHVTLQASSGGSTPIDPQVGATGGFAVVGISPSTSQSMTIVNGVVSSSRVLTTTWTLRAQKVGTSVLGPFTVSVDGKRYKASPIHVKVVPASQAPPRAQPRSNSPFNFDPFNGLLQQFGQMPGFEPILPREPEPQPATDPRLALDAPRGAVVFLHATIDKTTAVVGEQVTYSVYSYVDPQAVTSEPEGSDAHEAPANDFIRKSLLKDDQRNTERGLAMVGGRPWIFRLERREALFPLRAGDLPTGSMSMQIEGRSGGVRATEDLRVHVTEAPIDGRPPGYVSGDVGKLELATEVVGSDVEQDGAIGVDVTLTGTGNLPATIRPPEQRGVEWLEPQVTEKVGPQSGNKWGGTRTFHYVVRLHRAGDVDLGEVTLPYWDPEAKAYAIARAPLRTIHVTPSAAAKAVDAPADPLPGLPAARRALDGGAARSSRHLADMPAFWVGLGAMPMAYAVAIAASATMKRERERRAARGKSPKDELKARVTAADEASAKGDAGALDGATARALEAACVAGPNVRLRALATSDVARALGDAKVDAEVAREVQDVLRACEEARFSAGQADDASEARARWARARAVIDRLAGAA